MFDPLRTALHFAAAVGDAEMVALLLAAGANPTLEAEGMTASDAAEEGRTDVRHCRPLVHRYDAAIARLEKGVAEWRRSHMAV